jgi:DNA-binding HxlR family transcriptional regulator
LEKLVSNGILDKTQNPKNKLTFDYVLTKKSQELEPILLALGNWGNKNIAGTNKVEEQLKKLNKK